jgi:Flp pilus assembly protein TadD
MDRIHWFINETRLEAPIMWMLGSDDDVERVLATLSPEERDAPEAAYDRAIGLLARRKFDEASAAFALAARGSAYEENATLLRAYALHADGRHEEARAHLASVDAAKLATPSADAFVKWLDKTFPK